MIKRDDLVNQLNKLLAVEKFKDYCPNGLQVAGTNTIKKVMTAVTASQAAIEAAIAEQADMLLVHHGYFWRGESAVITGVKQQRLKALLTHDINLMAYHLPLDAHQVHGNNIQLMQRLAVAFERVSAVNEIFFIGGLTEPMSGAQLAAQIKKITARAPLHIAVRQQPLRKIGVCTGAAQDLLELAHLEQCDAFISGEVSERTWHLAHELNIDYFAAGHHATERYGVQSLGKWLQQQGLKVIYQELDNPV